MQSANHVFLRGFGVRAIKPQVFLRVLWPYSPQTMHFYVGFGAGAIGVPIFLHVLWFFLRQTMYFYVVSVQGATGVVGKRCIFALFRCRGYRGPVFFACFVVLSSPNHVFLRGFGAGGYRGSRQTMYFCIVSVQGL
jgi:hypothetical protein